MNLDKKKKKVTTDTQNISGIEVHRVLKMGAAARLQLCTQNGMPVRQRR